MQFSMILEAEMTPVPDTIKVIENWGPIETCDDEGEIQARGEHVAINADPKEIKKWLKPFRKVWVGKGPVMAQHFIAMHIKE